MHVPGRKVGRPKKVVIPEKAVLPVAPVHVATKYDFKPVLVSAVRATAKYESFMNIHKDEDGIARDADNLQVNIDMQWQKQPWKLEAFLDEYGEQGFEPCFQFTFPGNTFTYLIFKREKGR